jgi:hypothetical protein
MKTVDGGRQTAIGQAFQLVGKQTVNEWGTNKRMETADRRRTGVPACQKTSIERGAMKNFVPLRLGGLFFSHHEGTKTQRLRKTVNE